jgi:hypothetical protein
MSDKDNCDCTTGSSTDCYPLQVIDIIAGENKIISHTLASRFLGGYFINTNTGKVVALNVTVLDENRISLSYKCDVRVSGLLCKKASSFPATEFDGFDISCLTGSEKNCLGSIGKFDICDYKDTQ